MTDLADLCRAYPGGIDGLATASESSAPSIYRAINRETKRPPMATLRRLESPLGLPLSRLVDLWTHGASPSRLSDALRLLEEHARRLADLEAAVGELAAQNPSP